MSYYDAVRGKISMKKEENQKEYTRMHKSALKSTFIPKIFMVQ